jgi:hypothetical protein
MKLRISRRLAIAAAVAGLLGSAQALAQDAYITNTNGDTVSVIATATNTLLGSPIPVGPGPNAVWQVYSAGAGVAGIRGDARVFQLSRPDVAALARQFGRLGAAAAALGFLSVKALQTAISTFCRV